MLKDHISSECVHISGTASVNEESLAGKDRICQPSQSFETNVVKLPTRLLLPKNVFLF